MYIFIQKLIDNGYKRIDLLSDNGGPLIPGDSSALQNLTDMNAFLTPFLLDGQLPPNSPLGYAHFDIEPHVSLSGWPNQDSVPKYLDFLQSLVDKKGNMLISVAIPVVNTNPGFNFNTINVNYPNANSPTRTLTECVVDIVDEVVLMDYYSDSDIQKIKDNADIAINYAATHNKKVTIGLEVKKCTDEATLEKIIADLISHYETNKGFGGVAVDDFTDWNNLFLDPTNKNQIP